MTADHFIPYKETILKCIESCTKIEQLHCCWDMLERFKDVFALSVSHNEREAAFDEIINAYMVMQIKLHI